jgi:hypothetical protein
MDVEPNNVPDNVEPNIEQISDEMDTNVAAINVLNSEVLIILSQTICFSDFDK